MTNPLYVAIKKSVLGRFATYIVQFSSLAIYARMFTPNEFGIIASIQVFVVFFQMLAYVGIGPALINEKTIEPNKRNGIFTVTLLIGLVLSILFYLFSYFLNDFYTGFEYQTIATFVCFSLMFNAFSILPVTAFNKDTKFLSVAYFDTFSELISLVVVYVLYSQGVGVLALATRSATQSFFKFILSWYFSVNTTTGRATVGTELYHIKSILKFSLYQFGFNFINYFSRNLDNILIAKYFGMNSVGLYEKAYQLMRYPLMITTFAMAPAIQPVLTKYKDDKARIVKEHNILACRLLAISMLISAFMFINSTNIILVLFGNNWVDIDPLIKIFAFMIPIQAVLSTSGAFFQAMNQPKLLFIAGVISAIFNVTSIILGISFSDMELLALFLVVSFSINFFQSYFILFKYCFRVSSFDFYKGLLKVVVIIMLPVFLYCTLASTILVGNYLPIIGLGLNGLLSFACLVFFSRPIKRVLKM